MDLIRVWTEHTEAGCVPADSLHIELAAEVGSKADTDEVVRVLHQYGDAFRSAVMPVILAAFERVIMGHIERIEDFEE